MAFCESIQLSLAQVPIQFLLLKITKISEQIISNQCLKNTENIKGCVTHHVNIVKTWIQDLLTKVPKTYMSPQERNRKLASESEVASQIEGLGCKYADVRFIT